MEGQPDILLEDHQPLVPARAPQSQRQASLYGIAYTLDVEPAVQSGPFFPCRSCTKPIFDGGIPRICQCNCGNLSIRSEDLTISAASFLKISSFEDKFKVREHLPPPGEVPQLTSVTFGLFEGAGMDPDTALRNVLLPFILYRERCFGLSDLFSVSTLRFKVLSAEPFYGVVRRGTKVMCYQTLLTQPIIGLTVAALYPGVLSQSLVDRLVTPFLLQELRHVHLNQYLYRPEGQFVIVHANPPSGFSGDWTQIVIEPRPLVNLQSVAFHPNFATFPQDFFQLPPQQLQSLLQEGYLRPYFLGSLQPIYTGAVVRIAGLEFTVAPITAALGFVGNRTAISVVLPQQPPPLIISTTNIDILQHILRFTNALYPQAVVPQPSTPAAVLSALPTRQLSAGSRLACTVCLVSFAAGDTLRTLPCFHEFHTHCIDSWLARSQHCPSCRTNVVEELERAQKAG